MFKLQVYLLSITSMFAFSGMALSKTDLPPDITLTGKGCEKAKTTIDQSLASISIEFDEFRAISGAKTPLSRGRTVCQGLLSLGKGDGTQFALEKIEFSGLNGQLDRSASGLLKVSTYYQGQSSTVSADADFGGGKPVPEQITLEPNAEWSACGESKTVVLKVELRMKGRGNLSEIGIGKAHVGIKWRACAQK